MFQYRMAIHSTYTSFVPKYTLLHFTLTIEKALRQDPCLENLFLKIWIPRSSYLRVIKSRAGSTESLCLCAWPTCFRVASL